MGCPTAAAIDQRFLEVRWRRRIAIVWKLMRKVAAILEGCEIIRIVPGFG
jgi:hypothetical protein